MSKASKALICSAVLSAVLVVFSAVAFAEGNTGYVSASLLNLREGPGTYYAIVTQIPQGSAVDIIGSVEGWYNVNYGGCTGWVSAEYVTVEAPTLQGTIVGNSVNFRSGPGTWYDVIGSMYYGEGVTVLGRSDGWFNIQRSDGTIGWVCGDYISVGGSDRSMEQGMKIVNSAMGFLGVPYVYGGSSPSGFDCSGFVKYVLSTLNGIWVERVAADQANGGTYVDKGSLRPGDLVFFDTNGGHAYINHAGIYIGNGSFIHASSGAGSVVTSSIWDGFYANNYMTARRYTR